MTSVFVPPTSQHELENEITSLVAHISAATYRLLTLLREYDLRSGWNDGGSKSCAHWLNWKCGIALSAAREKVRVAHALSELPQISQAFREGRLSYSKVRAMSRIATPENEDYLLMIADHGTASHVERVVRGYRRLGRDEALEREQLRHAERQLKWFIDDDGCYVVHAKLAPEAGARFVQALSLGMDLQYRESEGSEPAQPAEPVATRRADALARISEDFIAYGAKASSGGDRYTLHLHTDVETLRHDGASAEAKLEDGPSVSAETSRRMACDCGVVHWHEDARGNTLDVGRRTRSISPALRRALMRRDNGCTFPGCTARHHVDAHHIRHWADGGETRLDNLVLLCRHHHCLVHEGGFAVSLNDEQRAAFTDPLGNAIKTGPDSRFRGNVSVLEQVNQQAGAEIDENTARSRWRGEPMDLGMVMDGLIKRKPPG